MSIAHINKPRPAQRRTTKSAAAPAVVDARRNEANESLDEQEEAAARTTLKANNAAPKQRQKKKVLAVPRPDYRSIYLDHIKSLTDFEKRSALRNTRQHLDSFPHHRTATSTPERSRWLGRPYHLFSTSAIDAATREYD
ncbi:hypothetical protein K438DRAFT_1772523 [Mycena galopus ATCC 62051]|nr:hypothetical protein K438DRAFT_1772523 [Mycena galopus ATCC 62051]